jgi:hypothetical protein
VSDIKLTSKLRAMLCWLDETDGLPPRVGLMANNPELAHELKQVLEALGLVKAESVPGAWAYRLTEEGRERAAATRYDKSGRGCQSCVQVHCVCRLSLVCLKGEGHGGCNGSHD